MQKDIFKNLSLDFAKIAAETLEKEAQELLDSAKKMTQINWQEIIKAILESSSNGGKLIVCGVGKSGHIGKKIAATLASTSTPSFFLHPTEALHGDLGMVGARDIMLVISYSGESAEVLEIMPHLKRLSRAIITMSKSSASPLSQMGDYFLPIAIGKEACPINAAPMSSTTLTLAMGDALAACLMKAREFDKMDFGSFHPGGSLGKRLFIKVSDIMQKENLPIIDERTPLKSAIITMSEKRLGSALITKNDKLVAILSDGDLRRAMMRDDFDLNAPAIEFATRAPKVWRDESKLASQALDFIEENKIQLLIVVDNDDKILGVLHLHTLIHIGIKGDKNV